LVPTLNEMNTPITITASPESTTVVTTVRSCNDERQSLARRSIQPRQSHSRISAR
jgi:hypothetical protein